MTEIIKAFIRLNAYGNDPDIQSIGSVLHQIYVGSQAGYMYLDHGWQTLIDGLVTVAKNAGVRIILGGKGNQVEKN